MSVTRPLLLIVAALAIAPPSTASSPRDQRAGADSRLSTVTLVISGMT